MKTRTGAFFTDMQTGISLGSPKITYGRRKNALKELHGILIT
jgi:hypothetical protein